VAGATDSESVNGRCIYVFAEKQSEENCILTMISDVVFQNGMMVKMASVDCDWQCSCIFLVFVIRA
jgi:hypothetical protein